MTVRVAIAPGVDESAVWRELDYPITTMQSLGYDIAVAGTMPYEKNAQAPTVRGSVEIVVAANPADQPDLTDDIGVAKAIAERGEQGDMYYSVAVVVNGRTGLRGDYILHELGHAVGLEHKDGTIMQARGDSPATFDSSETAAIDCR